jgi:hypothetical protein
MGRRRETERKKERYTMANGFQYEEEKDVVVAEMGTVELGNDTVLNVTLRSYNSGPEKVSIQKQGTKKDGTPWGTANVGRLTAPQASELAQILGACTRGIG